MEEREKLALKKVLGSKEPSESREDKEFTIFVDEDERYTCDCEDFTFREGSYDITYKDEQGVEHSQKGCKHIAKHLKKFGLEVRAMKGGMLLEP